jgi:hypothetical protein
MTITVICNANLTVPDLKVEARKRGLKQVDAKPDLVGRLEEHDLKRQLNQITPY